jgi:hypothetical protein
VFLAHDAGLTDEEIGRVAWGPDAPYWDALDAALIRAVDELLEGGAIGEATWAVLAGQLDTRQLLDVIFTAGAYETLDADVRLARGRLRRRPLRGPA